mmetsp:Transcript_10163/g.27996  ORF Transcript_10163/g.27996 Transcript_10163/m.27996 type:complete len:98 (+) Transcript_10163:1006-1299(+)
MIAMWKVIVIQRLTLRMMKIMIMTPRPTPPDELAKRKVGAVGIKSRRLFWITTLARQPPPDSFNRSPRQAPLTDSSNPRILFVKHDTLKSFSISLSL